jgi:polysaccharide export outer membrane protein
MSRLTVCLAAASLLSVALPVSAQTTPGAPASLETQQGYVLGPRDTMAVAVVGRQDYNAQVQVQDDGTITLPLIGTINAANVPVLQLKTEIERRLRAGGYFLKPEVTVTVLSASSQYVVLLGEISSSGLAPLDRQYRLSELIARAGGPRNGADVVTLTLPSGENREYSLRAIATGVSPDPVIVTGTKVYMQPAQMFYIYGQVGSQGTFPIEQGMTVRHALARAGGITSLGSTKKIKIYRGDKVVKATMTTKILPGDTIHIGERFF